MLSDFLKHDHEIGAEKRCETYLVAKKSHISRGK